VALALPVLLSVAGNHGTVLHFFPCRCFLAMAGVLPDGDHWQSQWHTSHCLPFEVQPFWGLRHYFRANP